MALVTKKNYCMNLLKQQRKTLFSKLEDIYLELRKENHEGFMQCNLLKKLVETEKLNFLIISLLNIDVGYVFSIKTPAKEHMVCHNSYKDSSILNFIDNEEIPYDFLDLLHDYPHTLMYDGYCIAEVRDFKGTNNNAPLRSYFVLLSPTNQTLMGCVKILAHDMLLTKEEQMEMEACIIRKSNSLCLDPDVSVSITANTIQYYNHPLSSPVLKIDAVNRWTIAVEALQHRKLVTPSSVKLLDYTEANAPSVSDENLFLMLKHYIQCEIKEEPYLPNCEDFRPSIDTYLRNRSFKSYRRTKYELPFLKHERVEKYTFEYEVLGIDGKVLNCCDNVSIFQSHDDGLYLGKLHTNSLKKTHLQKAKQLVESSPDLFPLGTRASLDAFLSQFTKTLSDGYTRYIKVTLEKPDSFPVVVFISGVEYCMIPKSYIECQTSVQETKLDTSDGETDAIVPDKQAMEESIRTGKEEETITCDITFLEETDANIVNIQAMQESFSEGKEDKMKTDYIDKTDARIANKLAMEESISVRKEEETNTDDISFTELSSFLRIENNFTVCNQEEVLERNLVEEAVWERSTTSVSEEKPDEGYTEILRFFDKSISSTCSEEISFESEDDESLESSWESWETSLDESTTDNEYLTIFGLVSRTISPFCSPENTMEMDFNETETDENLENRCERSATSIPEISADKDNSTTFEFFRSHFSICHPDNKLEMDVNKPGTDKNLESRCKRNVTSLPKSSTKKDYSTTSELFQRHFSSVCGPDNKLEIDFTKTETDKNQESKCARIATSTQESSTDKGSHVNLDAQIHLLMRSICSDSVHAVSPISQSTTSKSVGNANSDGETYFTCEGDFSSYNAEDTQMARFPESHG